MTDPNDITTPQRLADLIREIAFATQDVAHRARLLAMAQRTEDFFAAAELPPTAPGMNLVELWLYQSQLDHWRTLALHHRRIQALEKAISAGRVHDHTEPTG